MVNKKGFHIVLQALLAGGLWVIAFNGIKDSMIHIFLFLVFMIGYGLSNWYEGRYC